MIIALLLVACGPSPNPTEETAPLPVETPSKIPSDPDSTNLRGSTGAPKDYEELLDALQEQGMKVEMGGPMLETNGFSIPANFMTLPNPQQESLLVWVYEDETSASADAEIVAPDGGSIGTTSAAWIDTPHFYQHANLIVIYVGSDPGTLAALEAVLGDQFAVG